MRLIDVDAFKVDYRMADECKDCKTPVRACEYDRTYTKMDFCSWLDGAPTIEPPHWIPCSERLPEKDGDYLVTYEKGYAEDYGFDLVGIAPFEVDCEGFGIWQENFDLYTLGSLGSDWVDIPVIAWLELPDPWKGETK